MDEEIILALKEKFFEKIEILVIEVNNNKMILNNMKKFNNITKYYSKFYFHNKIISKQNLFDKIKSRNEFDLIMIK